VINKREIIDAATALGLNPHVVEKDYVLGWLLWGISGHDALAASWVFKGGTCHFASAKPASHYGRSVTEKGH
jgi:predicted nucleotidyltransferase component of viral defense system